MILAVVYIAMLFPIIFRTGSIMLIQAETIDDLLHDVFTKLLSRPFDIDASRGKFSEIIGVMLKLENPRARLSRTERRGKPFSALGELLWYLSKTNNLEFIKYYLPNYEKESVDGKTIHGGYGPRLFNMRNQFDQVKNVISLLKDRNSSRSPTH